MQKLLLALLLLPASVLAQQAHPAKHPHHVAAKAPKPAATSSAAAAYFCNSGNTVKYHASPSCRGLTRCSASVEKLALSDAQGSMEPCKICH